MFRSSSERGVRNRCQRSGARSSTVAPNIGCSSKRMTRDLTALLSESGQILERHGPSRSSPSDTGSHPDSCERKALWRNLDPYDRQLVAGACTQPEPFDNNVHNWRVDRLRARRTNQLGYGIQILNGNSCDVARVPVDPQDEHSSKAVREGRECVGKPIAVRCVSIEAPANRTSVKSRVLLSPIRMLFNSDSVLLKYGAVGDTAQTFTTPFLLSTRPLPR